MLFSMRHYSVFDQIISRVDRVLSSIMPAITHITGHSSSSSSHIDPAYPTPKPTTDPDSQATPLTKAEAAHSAALMRINHSGEVCAQALYLGQALVARNQTLANQLQLAAKEEEAHLRWCKERIQTLEGRTSFLNPLWAIGSFGIGVIAGLANDKISLGFLAETEKQVSMHLENHLKEISPNDQPSRAILTQMREDEERHATFALTEGGVSLPKPVCLGMQIASKIMTVTARYI